MAEATTKRPLEVHGRIASILAAMEAATIMEKQFEALTQHEYLEKIRAGELEMEAQKQKLLDAYAEGLSMKRFGCANNQVSVVAGERIRYCSTQGMEVNNAAENTERR